MTARSLSGGACRLSVGLWIVLSGLSFLLLSLLAGDTPPALLLSSMACMAVLACAGALFILPRCAGPKAPENRLPKES